ncbi:bifunctional adenosylcobinamide kinase/adenosylcobinamide-phosphate guanylyltransferase [Altericista sp. CCNU0014]|uniref:bifunctional adenosylcobinamide kinase/adenosylcobinamide-phosphate guanylyltransferase n=1 Tax=Altericista sp. CCNU0014 TaxID=3082949 RepID=UPI00384F09D8
MTNPSVLRQEVGRLSLVTGPSRSGKSDWAEALATQSGQPVLYIATSINSPDDLEWQARIQRHRDRRPAHWTLWEVPHTLADAIAQAPERHCILIDSLGTWLANQIDQPTAQWQKTEAELLATLQRSAQPIILVAEEVGWGVVPAYPVGRLFRDRLGTLSRRIGVIADRVYLVAAGYALDLKTLGHPVP